MSCPNCTNSGAKRTGYIPESMFLEAYSEAMAGKNHLWPSHSNTRVWKFTTWVPDRTK